MEIKHLQLKWEEIPKTENVILQSVEKSYLKIIYTEWGIFYVILFLIGAGLFYFNSNIQSVFLMIGTAILFVLLILITFAVAAKAFSFRAYAIRERDVMTRSGWLFQKLQVIPIDKIQHCIIKTGPLEKKLKLASLKLFTAGHQSDITLSGLKAEQAEQLKEWIVSKKQEDA